MKAFSAITKRAGILLVLAFFSFSQLLSCKAKLTEYYDSAALDIMTTGYWVVTFFSEGGTNITPDFAGWEARFNRDYTLQLSKSGASAVLGTWSSNNLQVDITANLSSTATAPLPKFSGTWLVTGNTGAGTTFSQTKIGVVYTMTLAKR